MRYLLDTATAANNALMPEVLPNRIRALLDTDELKGLCSVSLVELAIHFRRGRLQLKSSLKEFFDRLNTRDIELLDITPAVATATNDLPEEFPGDPFDRVIAATAQVAGLTLVTADSAIRDAGCCRTLHYPFRPGRMKR